MADQANPEITAPETESAPNPAQTSPERANPYDLGDTELHLSHPEQPPRDPETGRFISSESSEPPPQTSPSPSHPAWLVKEAAALGFDDADIKDMPTSALTKTVYLHQKQQSSLREQFLRERTLDERSVRQPEPQPPELEPELDLGIKEEDWDPQIVKALRTLAREAVDAKKQAKALEVKLEERDKASQQRRRNHGVALVDAAFGRLPPEFKRIVGEGPGSKMPGDSGTFQRRIAILMAAGVNMDDINPATIDGQVEQATRALAKDLSDLIPAADPYKAALEKKQAPSEEPSARRISPEQWNGAGLARPTHRAGAAEPKGEDLAIRNLDAKMRANESVGDQEFYDSIP